ncbi:hypothetical protein ACFFKU_18225 [Kineococcus gynurae]|uniref:Glycosyl transferase family 28 C-terminal domain-containing protein n=1 Tax=Kineococcus gynurae TaxID=452979 RepID=A0ABV5LNH4_9ACTN
MSAPIGYYVHHQGDGHRRRALAVAQHLDRPVTGLSSLPAPDGWPGDWVELPRDDVPAPLPDADATAGGRLHWVPLDHPGLRERAARVSSWVAAARPALVVVDVSVEMTLLLRLHGVPVVVAAMLGDRDDPVHTLGRAAATALFAPWPAPAGRTTGEVHHVGAFSRFDHLSPTPVPGTGRVLRLWGLGGSDVDATQLAAAEAATPGWTWATPGPDVWADLGAAEVVVVHGGHNAVAEVAAARRPAVVVAQHRPFAEQHRRVERLRELGIVALDAWPPAADWPGLLDRARGVGGAVWQAWSPGDGARRTAVWLERLASAREASR